MRKVGANYGTLKRILKHRGIDISHINLGIRSRKNKSGADYRGYYGIPPDEILIENSPYLGSGAALKRKLLRIGITMSNCNICGLGPEWINKPLVLRLDHINGVHSDNRVDNLRLVCPNCDSQLPTYCGRNNKQPIS